MYIIIVLLITFKININTERTVHGNDRGTDIILLLNADLNTSIRIVLLLINNYK